MNKEEQIIEQSRKIHLQLRIPDDEKHQAWLQSQADTYAAAVGYVSYFIEQRAQMGDMTTTAVLEEFNKNVNKFMIGGYDVLGKQ